MLGEFCYWIFNMSIIASLAGLLVLIVGKLGAIPHRVSVFLWIIPFVRMCLPIGLNSPYSLMTLISRLTSRTVTVYRPAGAVEFSATNFIMAADSYFPVTYRVDILGRIFDIAAVVWLVGAAAIIIALTILYASTKREIGDSKLLSRRYLYEPGFDGQLSACTSLKYSTVHRTRQGRGSRKEPKERRLKRVGILRDNVYLSEKVDSPAVYGIVRPRIVLPVSYAERELKYILRHEDTHIRRRDNLFRALGFLAAAVHWFNPIVWVFLKAFLSELELACDEAAVSGYSDEERKEYASTLLECSRSRSLFASAFGGAGMRTRIENVLSYKRMTALSAVGFTALILAIAAALLTNAG